MNIWEIIFGALCASIVASIFSVLGWLLRLMKDKKEVKFLIRLELERCIRRIEKRQKETSETGKLLIVDVITDDILYNTKTLRSVLSEKDINNIEKIYALDYLYNYWNDAKQNQDERQRSKWWDEFQKRVLDFDLSPIQEIIKKLK